MSQDPIALPGHPGAFHHPAQAFRKGGCFAIYFLQTEGVMLQVEMGIGQAGQNNTPLKIHPIGTGIQQLIPTHSKNFAVVDQQCTRERLRGMHGMDAGVVD
jgi:hypothetical protein